MRHWYSPRSNCCTTKVITWTPIQSGTYIFVVSIELETGQRIVRQDWIRGKYRRSSVWSHSSFWCFETKVDWLSVFADDHTTSGVIPASEEEIVSRCGHRKFK